MSSPGNSACSFCCSVLTPCATTMSYCARRPAPQMMRLTVPAVFPSISISRGCTTMASATAGFVTAIRVMSKSVARTIDRPAVMTMPLEAGFGSGRPGRRATTRNGRCLRVHRRLREQQPGTRIPQILGDIGFMASRWAVTSSPLRSSASRRESSRPCKAPAAGGAEPAWAGRHDHPASLVRRLDGRRCRRPHQRGQDHAGRDRRGDVQRVPQDEQQLAPSSTRAPPARRLRGSPGASRRSTGWACRPLLPGCS